MTQQVQITEGAPLDAMTKEELYKLLRAGRLVSFYNQTMKAVEVMSEKVHDHPNSPYSRDNASVLAAQASALRIIGNELRAWHRFLHPESEAVSK